jgi:hypothetical protein
VLILKSVAFQKSVDTEPISSLSTIIDNTLSREPISLQAVNINFKHQTFLFSASFMEHSSGDKPKRRNPISYIRSKTSKPVAFGAKLRASFLASPVTGNGHIGVRESTASIVFDTLELKSGTYWTIYSIGDYEEALALKWLDQGKQGAYTSPQEVFLDKLGGRAGFIWANTQLTPIARIIDFAVDNGMSAVLKTLEDELDGDSTVSVPGVSTHVPITNSLLALPERRREALIRQPDLLENQEPSMVATATPADATEYLQPHDPSRRLREDQAGAAEGRREGPSNPSW